MRYPKVDYSPARSRSLARRRFAAFAAAIAVTGSGLSTLAGASQKVYSAEDLFQPFLSASLSQWLVGPIARLATEDEIDRYLHLQSDDDARRFIEEFWARRDTDPAKPGNPALELYETRAAEADKKFSEAAVAGRRTDRGTIHILYGEPEAIEYEEFRDVQGPDVELWRYPKKAESGLDSRRPEREYRFAKLGDLTSFFSPHDLRDPRRRREASEPGFPGGGPGDRVPDEPGLPGQPP
jgi:GWxTD domain-containing protein